MRYTYSSPFLRQLYHHTAELVKRNHFHAESARGVAGQGGEHGLLRTEGGRCLAPLLMRRRGVFETIFFLTTTCGGAMITKLPNARVVELADSLDSGSSAHSGRAGSSPASRTKTLWFQRPQGFSFGVER